MQMVLTVLITVVCCCFCCVTRCCIVKCLWKLGAKCAEGDEADEDVKKEDRSKRYIVDDQES